MKRALMVVSCAIVLSILAGIGQAGAYTWPEQKAGLLYKLTSGDNGCAIYSAGRGGIEIDCATKVGGIWQKGVVAKCAASGVKQVCSSSLEFYSFDSEAVKCGKVCGGLGWTKIR